MKNEHSASALCSFLLIFVYLSKRALSDKNCSSLSISRDTYTPFFLITLISTRTRGERGIEARAGFLFTSRSNIKPERHPLSIIPSAVDICSVSSATDGVTPARENHRFIVLVWKKVSGSSTSGSPSSISASASARSDKRLSREVQSTISRVPIFFAERVTSKGFVCGRIYIDKILVQSVEQLVVTALGYNQPRTTVGVEMLIQLRENKRA